MQRSLTSPGSGSLSVSLGLQRVILRDGEENLHRAVGQPIQSTQQMLASTTALTWPLFLCLIRATRRQDQTCQLSEKGTSISSQMT